MSRLREASQCDWLPEWRWLEQEGFPFNQVILIIILIIILTIIVTINVTITVRIIVVIIVTMWSVFGLRIF